MTEYTPTTKEIIEHWAFVPAQDVDPAARDQHIRRAEAFRRWLAAHDAEVRARAEAVVAMSAYDDGYTAGEAAARAEDGIRLREFHGDGVWRDDTGTIWVRQAELVDAVRAEAWDARFADRHGLPGATTLLSERDGRNPHRSVNR